MREEDILGQRTNMRKSRIGRNSTRSWVYMWYSAMKGLVRYKNR